MRRLVSILARVVSAIVGSPRIKKIIIIVCILFVAVILFYQKHYVTPNHSYVVCPKEKIIASYVRDNGFTSGPDMILNSKKDYERACRVWDIPKCCKLEMFDFDHYTYILVQGTRIGKMYYSLKTTLLDDPAPGSLKAYHKGKFWLVLEYLENGDDGNFHIYRIDKNNYIVGYQGDG